MLFGWAPALHAMNADVRGAMASATAGSTAPVRGRRTLWALVVAEFALASLMFVCGGLLVRAYDRVRNIDPGFDPIERADLHRSLPGVTYADSAERIAFCESAAKSGCATLPGRRHERARSPAPRSAAATGACSIQPKARRHARPTIRIRSS